MRSFKQYLREETIQPGTVTFSIDITFEDDLTDRAYNALDTRLKKYIKSHQLVCDMAGNEFYVEVRNLNASNGSQEALEQLYDEVMDEVRAAARHLVIDSEESYLTSIGFPPYKLEWQYIQIYCQEKQRITGINKMIGVNMDCEFKNCDNIVGGVLSLLKIDTGKVYLFPAGTGKPKWFDILHKYLNGSKNIMDCQEELMDNGLEEYAQL